MQQQVDLFNEASRGKWHVTTKPLPSREGMHLILAEKEHPVLWSPGNPIWPARLDEVWSKKHPGTHILDVASPESYRVYLKSPLVFLTTSEKVGFLRPYLGGPRPWEGLRRLDSGAVKPPWGRFRFSHADPVTSSSGILTLGLMLADFGSSAAHAEPLDQLAEGPAFASYLTSVEKGFRYDTPCQKGTTALTRAFLDDTDRYDVITAYESAALEAAAKDPRLAVIYPTPTAVAEHAVALLDAPWVSPEQREAAKTFMVFLGTRQSITNGLRCYFRPAAGNQSLADVLGKHAAQGFRQSYTTAELPPYKALNAAAYQWRTHVAHTGGGEL